MRSLPYFDLLFESRKRGEAVAGVFDQFVHWGYWESPNSATGEASDFVEAMSRLNAEVLAPAEIGDRLSVLDAGCGFGGTLAGLNQSRKGMRLVGANIDERQLEVARSRVEPLGGNRIEFVTADACELPFPDASFDRVLAVECIFHFPSRLGFLREAARVLKPGGRLTLSDFVPARKGPAAASRWVEGIIAKGYGELGADWPDGGYSEMAAAAGLVPVLDRDVTRQTLPTYPALLRLIRESGSAKRLYWPTKLLAWVSRLGWVRYRVLAFSRP